MCVFVVGQKINIKWEIIIEKFDIPPQPSAFLAARNSLLFIDGKYLIEYKQIL